MRTTSTSNAKISYPDALSWVGDTLPVVVELTDASQSADVEVVVANKYRTAHTTHKGRAIFDVSALCRIAFDELLANDVIGSTPFSLAEKIELNVSYRATETSYPATKTEAFEKARFVRAFALQIRINGAAAVTTRLQLIYGRSGMFPQLGRNINKLWCGNYEALLVMFNNSGVMSVRGRWGNYVEEIQAPPLSEFTAIVLRETILSPTIQTAPAEPITITNAPYWTNSGGLGVRTQSIKYHASAVNCGAAFATFLTRDGLPFTTPVRPQSIIAAAEIASDVTRATLDEVSSTGAGIASPNNTRREVRYGVKDRIKYATFNLPKEELHVVRDIAASPLVYIFGDNPAAGYFKGFAPFRVYPVAAAVEINASQSIQGFTIEVELPNSEQHG